MFFTTTPHEPMTGPVASFSSSKRHKCYICTMFKPPICFVIVQCRPTLILGTRVCWETLMLHWSSAVTKWNPDWWVDPKPTDMILWLCVIEHNLPIEQLYKNHQLLQTWLWGIGLHLLCLQAVRDAHYEGTFAWKPDKYCLVVCLRKAIKRKVHTKCYW